MHKHVLFVFLLVFSVGCNLTTALSSGEKEAGENNPASVATLSALINEIKGHVQIKQPDQNDYANAREGLILQLQGLVKTGNDGRARLDLSSGTIVRVAPASVFALTENHAASDNSLVTKIKLEAGKLWIVLKGGTLDIDTSAGQAGVRGSYLSLEIDSTNFSVYVTCLEGNCLVTNPAGSLDLTSGQTARLLPGNPTTNTYSPPQLGTMTSQDFQDWKENVPEAIALIPVAPATEVATLPTSISPSIPTILPTLADVPCVITLSGAVSKTLACTVQIAFADGTTGIKIMSNSQSSGLTALPEVQFVAQIAGPMQPGAYDSGAQIASVIESITDVWTRDTQTGVGASSVTFSSVDVTSTSAQGTLYLAHGTVNATLEPQATATGTVTLTITF